MTTLPPIVAERLRWVVLFTMFGVGLMQGLVWMTFSGNPGVTKEYYGLSNPEATVNLLLNWGPIMYLPVAPFVAWATMRSMGSIWAVVLCGTFLTLAGSLVRLAPSFLPDFVLTSWGSLCCLHIGQALNGAAGPMNAVTPSLIAATWFPPSERTFATATVFGIQTASPAIGFLLALCVHESRDLIYLMVVEALFSALVALMWAFLPRQPKSPPSISQSLRSGSSMEMHSLPPRRWVSAWVLFLASGLAVGCFQTWSTSLPTELDGVLPGLLLKWFALITNSASFIGNFMAGPLTEKLGLQTHLSRIVWIALIAQLVGYLLFAVLLPNAPLSFGGQGSAGTLLVVLFVASLAEGIMAPVIYELGAELTYPYAESLSGAVYSWILNFFSLLQLFIFPFIPAEFGSFAMAGFCFVALLSMQLVREDYPRRQIDEQELTGETEGTCAMPFAIASRQPF